MSRATQPTRPNAAGLPPAHGLYDPANDHDGCGVGFVARLDGRPQHQVVRDAVSVLVNLEHRGAVGGDAATGDGAGLLLAVPDAFLLRTAEVEGLDLPATGRASPRSPKHAAGSITLTSNFTSPKRANARFFGFRSLFLARQGRFGPLV